MDCLSDRTLHPRCGWLPRPVAVATGRLRNQIVEVDFPQAVEASSLARYTWPSVAARAFGCVDVFSWDRRGDSAMFAFTRRALHGVGPLPAGDRSRQITKTDVTLVSHERPSLFPKSTSCDSVKMQECKCVPCLYTRVPTGITLT